MIPTLGGGGAERVLVNLVNNLDRSKYDITIQTIFKAGVNSSFLNPDIKFKEGRLKQFSGNIHVMKLLTPTMLYRMIIDKRYDIVVSYLEGPAARIVAGCPYPDSKLISWVHVEQHSITKASRSYRRTSEYINCSNKYHHIVCVAETVKEDLLSFYTPICPCSVVYNTNEDEKILLLAKEDASDVQLSNQINVFSVGRLVPEKGFDRLIKVHKRLIDGGAIHHIYILGGSNTLKLQAIVDETGVKDTFHLLGFKKNPYKYVSKADLFVCSSFREGFSTAVTEALIMGIPVVSTRVSGAEELLGKNNEYGIVTNLDDDALYEGLKQMLTDSNLLSRYRSQAQIRGQRFTKMSAVASAEKLFDNI